MTNNTNDEMVFNPTAVEQIDQSSVEQTGPAYPTIQWHYGDRSLAELGNVMRHLGGFFIPADVIDEALLLGAGWTKTTYKHPDGSQTEGFWRRDLAAAVVAIRKRWEVFQEGARSPQQFAWKDYETAQTAGRPSSRLQALCLIKGLTEAGPFVLTFKGAAAAAFEGTNNRSGALTAFGQTIIRRANQESDAAAAKANKPTGRRWPFRCFWLPVGAERDAKGNPVFTEVGKGSNSKHVVLPVSLGLPARPEDVTLARFYVGPELLQVGNQLYNEAEANWAHAWDSFQTQPEAAAKAPAANGAAPTAPAAAPSVLTQPAPSVLESLGL